MSTSTIKTRESEESSSGGEVYCGICRRQFSRYTCPSCNLFYCSLICFRSEAHSRCSETFYRKEVETGIKTESSKTAEERTKMLELLKRIEGQNLEQDELHLSDEDSEEDDLAQRLSTIDISSASADDLLRVLTKEEREEFFMALKNPSSGLVQQLLQSTELDKTRQLPWWEAPCDGADPHYGVEPDLMHVPRNLVTQPARGVSLVYNISAMLLAYSYVTRHLSMSPLSSTESDPQDKREACRILSQSVPFIVDHNSKLVHTSLTDAVLAFWSRLESGSIDDKTMGVLLEDIAKLVRPRRVTVTEDSQRGQERTVYLTSDHPMARTIMAISDISSLFSNVGDAPTVSRRQNQVVMKLTFYAAHILSTPSAFLHTLADEAALLSKSVSIEGREK